jgi:hypothetical protein
MGNPWVMVEWKGAHQSGPATVREDDGGGRWRQLRPEVISSEGVDVVELQT